MFTLRCVRPADRGDEAAGLPIGLGFLASQRLAGITLVERRYFQSHGVPDAAQPLRTTCAPHRNGSATDPERPSCGLPSNQGDPSTCLCTTTVARRPPAACLPARPPARRPPPAHPRFTAAHCDLLQDEAPAASSSNASGQRDTSSSSGSSSSSGGGGGGSRKKVGAAQMAERLQDSMGISLGPIGLTIGSGLAQGGSSSGSSDDEERSGVPPSASTSAQPQQQPKSVASLTTEEWRARYEQDGRVDLWLQEEFNAGSRIVVSGCLTSWVAEVDRFDLHFA